MLRDEYRMTAHRRLFSIVFRVLRSQPLPHKVLCVAADLVHALFGNIGLIVI